MPKVKKKNSMFFKTFVGSYLNIFVKSLKSYGRQNKISNVLLAGYLLDEDDDYIYIGQSSEEIFSAVKKDDIAAVTVAEEGEELMDLIDIPEGQEVQ